MKHFEVSGIEKRNINAKDESVGREAIPAEAALDAQQKLLMYMMPEELKVHISEKQDNSLLEDYTMRWMEKYAMEFNGFAEYCNFHADDAEFMKRVTQKNLSQEDLEAMMTFFEQSTLNESLFTEDEKLEFTNQIKS